MKKGYIVSAILGAGFVAVPLFMGIETPIAVGMGVIAYVAGNLIFSEKETDIKFESENLYDLLNSAKKTNAEICGMIDKVEDKQLQDDIREIYRISNKIIDTVSKNPAKQKSY